MNAFMIGATIVKIILVGRKAYDFKKGSNNNSSNSGINNDSNNNDHNNSTQTQEQLQSMSEVRF
eukprot:1389-Heterococcus_DN1.PRE.1